MAMAGVGGRIFNLAPLLVEDLALAYNVEAQIASQFPGAAPTKKLDRIVMTLGGVDFVAASRAGYAIDGDGLHDEAILIIKIDASTNIYGRGGDGGKGGDGEWDAEPPGTDLSIAGVSGSSGGTAIRFGCETLIKGSGGLITKGYGGGGGGGGGATGVGNISGGGGGGGGAALGSGGAKGIDQSLSSDDGVAGTQATNTANGTGGAAGGAEAGAGGDGGDSGSAAVAGNIGTKLGGSAGSDGNAIDSQGFTNSIDGAITVTGAII